MKSIEDLQADLTKSKQFFELADDMIKLHGDHMAWLQLKEYKKMRRKHGKKVRQIKSQIKNHKDTPKPNFFK